MRKILCLAGLSFILPAFASASILTFDQNVPVSNFENIDQAYGDNVTATTMGGFGYGVGAEGFTPNVTANYGPAGADPALWSTGYGDLSNILFKDADSFPTLAVTLTGEPGYGVALHSFDMAAFTTAFSVNPTINYIRVLNQSGELFRQNNAVISRTTHTDFDFPSALAGTFITIEFDAGNLAGLSDDIGFDNFMFSQYIPEPTVLALAALGLPMLIRRARR